MQSRSNRIYSQGSHCVTIGFSDFKCSVVILFVFIFSLFFFVGVVVVSIKFIIIKNMIFQKKRTLLNFKAVESFHFWYCYLTVAKNYCIYVITHWFYTTVFLFYVFCLEWPFWRCPITHHRGAVSFEIGKILITGKWLMFSHDNYRHPLLYFWYWFAIIV